MSQEYEYPFYRKVKDKKIFIEVDDKLKLTSIGLDFGRKGRCHFDNTKYLIDLPKVFKNQLCAGSGRYEICTEQEFLEAMEYASNSDELVKNVKGEYK